MNFLYLFAIIPSVIFIVFVYKMDKIEKEPLKLLLKLFFFGMISCFPAMIIETFFDGLFLLFMDGGSLTYALFSNFLGVALVEEACKFVFLYIFTWKNKNFNFAFDGIVYAVCVGIGFAFLEDILYLMDGDLSTAIIRALLAIPGHGVYAILMGHYYSQGKMLSNLGNKKGCKSRLIKALLIPIAFHGLYDFCLSVGSFLLVLGVLAIEVILYIRAYKTLKLRSRVDRPLPPEHR